MNKILYLISGILFGFGLSLSGMIDPLKIKGFLSVGFEDWNPALLFVLGSAVPVYFAVFTYLRKKKKTITGAVFKNPPLRPIDKKLIFGALIFGTGWGIAGLCPGPALVNLAFLQTELALFVFTMFIGFELQRRFA